MYLAPVTSLETFSNVGKRGKLEAGIHAVARDTWLLFPFFFKFYMFVLFRIWVSCLPDCPRTQYINRDDFELLVLLS